jgi:hypothetical protein
VAEKALQDETEEVVAVIVEMAQAEEAITETGLVGAVMEETAQEDFQVEIQDVVEEIGEMSK